MIELEVMKDASEIIKYDSELIPYAIQERWLSDYADMRALSHWHTDIEWIYIIEGQMNYDINGKVVHLSEGDFLMVNSRQLHFGYDDKKCECHFIVLLFHPDLFQCNIAMYQNDVQPVVENRNIDFLHMRAETGNRNEITGLVEKLVNFSQREEKTESYALIGTFYELWDKILRQLHIQKDVHNGNDYSEVALQKKMITYIYKHYQESLSLEDIAASGNICRSKCCRIFQKYLKQSPIDFLNAYRLEISRKLLMDTSYSITQIALSCGYNYASYYTRAFLKKYQESPSEYRKKQRMA